MPSALERVGMSRWSVLAAHLCAVVYKLLKTILEKNDEMKKLRLQLSVGFVLLLMACTVFAGESIKVVANDEFVQAGEELGVSLVLGGTASHDVYAAVTGGALGNGVVFIAQDGSTSKTPVKLRSNLNFGAIGAADRIVQVLPRVPLGGSGIAGKYTFYGALCTPGQLDFNIYDAITIELQ